MYTVKKLTLNLTHNITPNLHLYNAILAYISMLITMGKNITLESVIFNYFYELYIRNITLNMQI